MEQKATGRALRVIILTTFLDFLGLTLAIPVFTPLCLDPAGGILPPGTDPVVRTIILGLLLGVYPLCQFFSSPVLGTLSDRHGRKKVLSFSILGMLAGYLVMASGILFSSLVLVFASRILMGTLSGNLAVNQSAIADISDETSRPKNFGLFGAAFGAAFFVGPALGGLTSNPKIVPWFGYSVPFWIAAGLTLINFIQVVLRFPETLDPEHRRHTPFQPFSGPLNVIKAMRDPDRRILFLVSFFLGFGFNFFTQFFQVFLIDRFNVTTTETGIIFSFIGVCSIIVQAVIIRPVLKRLRPSQILLLTLVLLAALFPILLLMPSFFWLFPVVFFLPVFNGLAVPTLTSVISGLGDRKTQGQILGVNQSVQAVAQFVPPIAGGFVVGLHYTLPVWISAVMIFISWLLFMWCRKRHCIA